MGSCSSSEPPASREGQPAGRRTPSHSPSVQSPRVNVNLDQLVDAPADLDDADFMTALDPDEEREFEGEVIVVGAGGALVTPFRQQRLSQLPDEPATPLSPSMHGTPPCKLPPDLAAGLSSDPAKPRFLRNWDFFAEEQHVDHIRRGGVLFWFGCSPGTDLKPFERMSLSQVLNRSVFSDEVEENNVPHINMDSRHVLGDHIFVLQKSCYLLPPPLSCDDVRIETLSSASFRKATEPGRPKIWEDVTEPDTYRMTKTVIPVVYKVVVQFRLSFVPESELAELGAILMPGVPVSRAVLFERTKRDKSKTDQLKKMKMVHLYHELPGGGMLLVCVGGLCLSSVPKAVSPLVGKIGQMSGQDYADTATNIRRELLKINSRR